MPERPVHPQGGPETGISREFQVAHRGDGPSLGPCALAASPARGHSLGGRDPVLCSSWGCVLSLGKRLRVSDIKFSCSSFQHVI